jgi:fatty-acyl-CoA synthase
METPLTPLEFARRTRLLYPDREAVVDGDERWTYEGFLARCDRWAAALRSLGVGKGDRVAYVCPNTVAQLESFYAVPSIGAVLVPINFRLTADDFAYIVNHSGARVVCAHSDYLEAFDRVRGELTHVAHFVALNGGARPGWLSYEEVVADAPGDFKAADVEERDLLTINYTSGTTSRPKGVMITHRNAYMNVVGTLLHFPMSCRDRYLWTLPMFHANGWTFTWSVTAVGATHVCLPRVDNRMVFDLIRRERATSLCAAPTVLIGLANTAEDVRGEVPAGVRILTAGAPPAAATIQRIEGTFGWDLLHAYGLTETAPFITVCEPRPEHATLDPAASAVTKSRQGVELITSGELRVVDDEGRDVPADGQTLGEIVVRGNVVMEGYYNDPKASATALRGGWFHTGDAAVMHPDRYVEIRDRFKDIIISGGENISSVEVEATLLRHPSVVLRTGQSATEDELRTFLRGKLAHFKVPKTVTFLDELPKTATGKIQKYVLRRGASAISAQ